MSVVLPTVADLSPAQREAFELFPANLTRGLVMTKNSAKPYLTLGLSFRDGGLPPETRELVILRVGAVTRAQYEIHHHAPEAQRVGVPTGVIDAVVSGADSFGDERLAALTVSSTNYLPGSRAHPRLPTPFRSSTQTTKSPKSCYSLGTT